MIRGYDEWKTTPPEPEEEHVGYCESCDNEIIAGMDIIEDKDTRDIFCDEDCYTTYVARHLDHFMDTIIDTHARRTAAENA